MSSSGIYLNRFFLLVRLAYCAISNHFANTVKLRDKQGQATVEEIRNLEIYSRLTIVSICFLLVKLLIVQKAQIVTKCRQNKKTFLSIFLWKR